MSDQEGARRRSARARAGEQDHDLPDPRPAQPAESLPRPYGSIPPDQGRELQLFARELFGKRSDLFTVWKDACVVLGEAIEESVAETLEPLLVAWSCGKVAQAELHLADMVSTLRSRMVEVDAARSAMYGLLGAMGYVAPSSRWAGALVSAGTLLLEAINRGYAAPTAEPTGLESQVRRVRPEALILPRELGLVGSSEAMLAVGRTLHAVATAPGSVMIIGESGTGKELVARAIHRLGNHEDRPLISVNCAALPNDLIESELFGHERGAFTGSGGSKGLMRAAGRGLLFLDEVTEMPVATQPKLLRALDQRTIRPVGSVREMPFEARVVAATNRDPLEAVRSGALRADLYYRLCAHRIELPPLRERPSDIPALLDHFCGQLARGGHRVPRGFSSDAVRVLAAHTWPGNVRELRNVVEHCCAIVPQGLVEEHHLPGHVRLPAARAPLGPAAPAASPVKARVEPDDLDILPLHEVERRHIQRAMAKARGNKARAARLLSLSRHQLYGKLEKLGID